MTIEKIKYKAEMYGEGAAYSFEEIDTLLDEVALQKRNHANTKHWLSECRKQLAVATETLEIIAGERSCIDNLLSNADIARTTLERMKG